MQIANNNGKLHRASHAVGRLLLGFFLTLGIIYSSHPASSDWKPNQNVEIIAGTGPGGGVDRTARTIQRIFQDKILVGISASVVNKPGGGGAVGWAYLNQHPGNGHYLSVSILNLLTNNITGNSPLRHTDFAAIAQLFSEYIAFTVKTDSPIKTGRDLMERFRKDPATISVALSPSRGGVAHIALALAVKEAGIEAKQIKIVVFNTGSEASTALMGGHVELVPTSVSNAAPQLAAGKVRVIAVSSPQRLRGTFANVPTWREQGWNAVVDNWRGIIGPKQMSPAQIAYWEEIFGKLAESDEWKKDLENNMWTNNYMGSIDSQNFLATQYNELRRLLIDLGLAK